MDIINQSKRINLIIYLSTVLVFFYFSFLAPSNLTEFLLNDNNTAVYSVYARNILEYPIYKTYLLMSEIGPDGQNVFNYNNNDNEIQRYINHPPLLIWITAFFYKLFGYEIFYGRLVSILSSTLFFLFFMKFLVYLRVNNFKVIIAILLLLSMPIYWTHGLVIEHQPLLNLLLLLTAINFFKYRLEQKKIYLFLFIFFWTLGFLTDWPAYLFLIPFTFIFFLEKKYKLTFFSIIFPILIYFLINFYHQLSLNDFNLSAILGIDKLFLRSGVNLFPEKNFFQTWGISLFKMSYLFVYFNFKILISILFLVSIIFWITNYTKLDIQIIYLFLIFFIPVLIYMLIFRMWAESHSYWSYYFIIPIVTSIIFLMDIKNKKFKNIIIFFILINFLIQLFSTSKVILASKLNPLSVDTISFINKYSDYNYLTDDESIGFGFGFRNRWIQNKKFYNINFYQGKKSKTLIVKRLNNCKSEINFKKIEFFNWCYKENLK